MMMLSMMMKIMKFYLNFFYDKENPYVCDDDIDDCDCDCGCDVDVDDNNF